MLLSPNLSARGFTLQREAAQRPEFSQFFYDQPRHAVRTKTNTSAATTIQNNAFCGSGGDRGVSPIGVPQVPNEPKGDGAQIKGPAVPERREAA
jgi:hypothetical protein